MNRILLYSVLPAVILPLSATAQKPKAAPAPKPTMTAAQVLDKYVEVTGGKAAYEKITSSILKGKIEFKNQATTGAIEYYAKAPNKILVKQVRHGVGEFIQAFDGTEAWIRTPYVPLGLLQGGQLAAMKQEAVFNNAPKWRDLYKKAEMVGLRKVDGKDMYVLRLTPMAGLPLLRYYDAKTFLLMRSDTTQAGPQGTLTTESYFSDYRAADGVKVPCLVRQKGGRDEVVITIAEVKNNVPIADKTFTKPATADEPKP